ncbi:response regulator transcription factor [Kineosporia babensis]|uniref:Response regulator transcription factor n=1 Tax=Kineosporia babensis TaxID=499548 RepID=A0A9X1NC12_9ACTN|nr:response regulator transcription factor [Kineosporia babensis]
MSARIVICEDDDKFAELVRRYLEREGHTTLVVGDGRDAVAEVRRHPPDLLILDVMMPGIDGLDVCRILRAEYDLPILMVTARSTESDLVLGLDLGADDYLTKPCSPRELTARVRALLRRSQRAVVADESLRVDDLLIDPVRHRVSVGGVRIDCTAGEFALLEVLAAEPERVFTRKQLLQMTRGQDRYITERTIDVQVSALRRKLQTDPQRRPLIVTVFGVGYKLAGGREA